MHDPIEHIDDILRNTFGLSIGSLFSAISGENPALSFWEHKEAFFWLIEKLLRADKVKFIAPGADCYTSPSNPYPKWTIHDEEARWNAPLAAIISELRTQWPQHVNDEHDVDLTIYLHTIPSVIWVADDGTLRGS